MSWPEVREMLFGVLFIHQIIYNTKSLKGFYYSFSNSLKSTSVECTPKLFISGCKFSFADYAKCC